MDHDFWHRKWADKQIGFHEGEVNGLLAAYFDTLAIPAGGRIFLPLCGKTRDIAWLLNQGYQVAGAELSADAVDQLFDELGVTPEVTELAPVKKYSAPGIDVLVGDIFTVTGAILGSVDAIYDRAALVALPAEMRKHYTTHLMRLCPGTPQFLITFTYDQARMDGPPFSVPEDEVRRHYGTRYEITNAAHKELPGGMKGQTDATEDAWLLRAL